MRPRGDIKQIHKLVQFVGPFTFTALFLGALSGQRRLLGHR
jgi:hypothetical protein